jgi:hypothetical protein
MTGAAVAGLILAFALVQPYPHPAADQTSQSVRETPAGCPEV